MTKGWPSFAASRSAASRAIMSVLPPATNGTTIVTGRVGQSRRFGVSAEPSPHLLLLRAPSRLSVASAMVRFAASAPYDSEFRITSRLVLGEIRNHKEH
jgi:hypothetical protein